MNKQQIAFLLYYLIVFGLGYGIAYFYYARGWGLRIFGSIVILVAFADYPAFMNSIDKPTFATGFLFFHRHRIIYFLQNKIFILFSILRRNKKNNFDNRSSEKIYETPEEEKERKYREYEEDVNKKQEKPREKRQNKKEEKNQEEDFFDKLDPYQVFDLPKTATKEKIQAKYIVLAKLYHPDKYEQAGEVHRKESEKRMKMINYAFLELKKKF